MVLAEPVLVVFAGILGAMLGSFLNVCVFRLPRDESVIVPRSRCLSCGHSIAWYDNLPVVSWLVLRGRCRHCRVRISVQYPLVELAAALVWAGSLAWHGPSVAALSASIFLTLLLGITLTDARYMIIPDEFSLGGLGAGLALAMVPGGISPLRSLAGAALGFGLLWAAGTAGRWWYKRDAMGGGDLRMMAMVGAFLGPAGVLLTVFLGSLAGVLVFLPAIIRRERFREIPFGVFLAVGAVAALLVGTDLMAWYVATAWGR